MPTKEDLTEEYESVLALLGNDQDLLQDALSLLREGISEKTYAGVFQLLFYTSTDTKLTYSDSEKVWTRGEQTVSDLELISMFAEAVGLVRKIVTFQKDLFQYTALFPGWVNSKDLTKVDADMVTMESFPKIRTSLRFAAELMPKDSSGNAAANWQDQTDPEN